MERRNGWINVGDLQGAVHFKIVKYERIKFLVIALKDSIEIYAWAPKPYHKFMAFKVRVSSLLPSMCHQSKFSIAEFWRIESSSIAGWLDGWGADAIESHLWIGWRLPRCWFRLSDCLWYLSAKTCKIELWNRIESSRSSQVANANFSPADSRTDLSTLHRHLAELERYESAVVLRQRRRVR